MGPADHALTTFEVLPGRSAVLVKARSNVGRISFATSELRGEISAEVDGNVVDLGGAPVKAQVTVSLKELTSGNTLYDTELKRRIDARRYLKAVLELTQAVVAEGVNRYELEARMEIHNVVRPSSGVVIVEPVRRDVLVVCGQQTIDIREFDLKVPTTLALKIYPEVSVEMHIEARAQ